MKHPLRNLFGGQPAKSTPSKIDLRQGDAPAAVMEAPDTQWAGAATKTGETIYGDRPLRMQVNAMRKLTVAAPEIETLEHPALHGGFKIRVARRTGFKRNAGSLVEKRYSSRGYATPQTSSDPSLATFIAYDEGVLVGTVGVRLDSGNGLSADALYREEVNGLRARGFRVCEFTRLAVDKTVASKPVLAGLFHTAYLYAAVLRDHTHAVIEVNPRHVGFYRKALGFVPVGEERQNMRVNAPAILLAVPFAQIASGLKEHAGKPPSPETARSLYPYGFSADEEKSVLHRLRDLVRES